MLSRGVSLVVAMVLGALASTAVADDNSGKQKRADELFEEGRKLLTENNAAGACEKFNEAIRIDPEAPGTMLNLGLCNEKLMKYKTALYWFRKAQARAAETNLPQYEDAAKEHTVTLKRDKVATIKIAIAPPVPAGTRVKIDDDEVAPADYLSAEVDPGDHTLVVGAPGRKIITQQFTVVGRGGQTLEVELVEGDNSVIVDRGAGRRRAAIITAAGGGALLLGSLGVSWYAKGKYEKCAKDGDLQFVLDENGESTGELIASCPERDPLAAKDYAEDYRSLASTWGTGLFVAGVVTVGVAGFLYFTAPDKERIDRTVFTPVIGPNDVGFAISGGF